MRPSVQVCTSLIHRNQHLGLISWSSGQVIFHCSSDWCGQLIIPFFNFWGQFSPATNLIQSSLIKTFLKRFSALCSKALQWKRFYSLWATRGLDILGRHCVIDQIEATFPKSTHHLGSEISSFVDSQLSMLLDLHVQFCVWWAQSGRENNAWGISDTRVWNRNFSWSGSQFLLQFST